MILFRFIFIPLLWLYENREGCKRGKGKIKGKKKKNPRFYFACFTRVSKGRTKEISGWNLYLFFFLCSPFIYFTLFSFIFFSLFYPSIVRGILKGMRVQNGRSSGREKKRRGVLDGFQTSSRNLHKHTQATWYLPVID